MTHTHQFRPLWLLLTSPADLEGWQTVVFEGRCQVCGLVATLAGEQHPGRAQSRLREAGP
jgi:hypothetical protein